MAHIHSCYLILAHKWLTMAHIGSYWRISDIGSSWLILLGPEWRFCSNWLILSQYVPINVRWYESIWVHTNQWQRIREYAPACVNMSQCENMWANLSQYELIRVIHEEPKWANMSSYWFSYWLILAHIRYWLRIWANMSQCYWLILIGANLLKWAHLEPIWANQYESKWANMSRSEANMSQNEANRQCEPIWVDVSQYESK